MYSGGHAYFNKTLRTFGQSSSCFAMQNAHWLLVGLDPAYAEHDLANDQAAWLEGLVAAPEDRKVVLFSHHQPYSLLEAQGPKLVAKLSGLLAAGGLRLVLGPRASLRPLRHSTPRGTCSAVASATAATRTSAPSSRTAPRVQGDHDQVGWYRLPAKNLVPSGLLLDGPNPYLADHRDRLRPQRLCHPGVRWRNLTEFVHDPTGAVIWQSELA